MDASGLAAPHRHNRFLWHVGLLTHIIVLGRFAEKDVHERFQSCLGKLNVVHVVQILGDRLGFFVIVAVVDLVAVLPSARVLVFFCAHVFHFRSRCAFFVYVSKMLRVGQCNIGASCTPHHPHLSQDSRCRSGVYRAPTARCLRASPNTPRSQAPGTFVCAGIHPTGKNTGAQFFKTLPGKAPLRSNPFLSHHALAGVERRSGFQRHLGSPATIVVAVGKAGRQISREGATNSIGISPHSLDVRELVLAIPTSRCNLGQ
mmetsp:Transcript_60580/g.179573  ORF Transcript_60580/g.179573 Transcript_60580/m.179573 type:complete len:259 (+) Transcript_60580:951-1727(+)